MTTDLSGVYLKIKRANKHIKDLERHIVTFEETNPYEVITQDNPQDAECYQGIFKIRKPIPRCISLITGDAIHNLRSALDHLACAAVSIRGTVTTDTAFPIWRKSSIPTVHDYKALVLGKVKGAPQPFIDLLLGLQPYERGLHDDLWAIDYLDITDKHKLLIEAFGSYDSLIQFVGPLADRTKPDYPFPLKDGDVLFCGRYANKEQEPERLPVIAVALNEPRILKGKPITPTLTDLSETTTAIIDQLRRVL
ncbi:MAG: hypothetical protein WB698_06150 [Solirubrobacteraceae bacterium]